MLPLVFRPCGRIQLADEHHALAVTSSQTHVAEPLRLELPHRQRCQLLEVGAKQHIARLDSYRRRPGNRGNMRGMLQECPPNCSLDEWTAPTSPALLLIDGQVADEGNARKPKLLEGLGTGLAELVARNELHGHHGDRPFRNACQTIRERG